jgi:hypothetical protein
VAWTGSVVAASTKLNLLMESNTAVTAVFRTNLFPGVKGTYAGIFYDTNQVEQQSSGFVTLTLTDQGKYSAKLVINGRTVRWAGVFAADGGGTNEVTLFGLVRLKFLMTVDLNGGTDQITGLVTNQEWQAQLTMDRAVFRGSGTNVAPFAGNYTLVLPRDTNAVVGPAGVGFASVRMDKRGNTTFTGTLGDATRLSLKLPVSKTGSLPFYASLYRGSGAIVSWLQFDTNQAATDFSGLVNWFKQRKVTEPYNPLGFTNEMTLLGSRYLTTATNRIVALTNTMVGFTNGNLPANFANEITLEANNKVTVNNGNTNKLTLTLTKSTGLFSGRITPPYMTRPLTFKGAVFQKQSRGSGLLYGTTRTSQVELGP